MTEEAPSVSKDCVECGAPFVPNHHRRTKCYECSPIGSTSAERKYGRGKAPEGDIPKVSPSAGSTSGGSSIKTNVKNLVAGIGTTLALTGIATESPTAVYDGKVLAGRSEDIAEAVDELAKTHPAIKQALERLFTASGWGKIGITVAQVVVPIAANHGAIPREWVGPFINPDKGIDLPPERTKAKSEPKPAGPSKPKAAQNGGQPARTGTQQKRTIADIASDAGRMVADAVASHPDLPGWPGNLPIPDS